MVEISVCHNGSSVKINVDSSIGLDGLQECIKTKLGCSSITKMEVFDKDFQEWFTVEKMSDIEMASGNIELKVETGAVSVTIIQGSRNWGRGTLAPPIIFHGGEAFPILYWDGGGCMRLVTSKFGLTFGFCTNTRLEIVGKREWEKGGVYNTSLLILSQHFIVVIYPLQLILPPDIYFFFLIRQHQ